MAVAFTIRNMQWGYLDLIEAIRKNGRKVAPRGMPTLELASPVIELTNPRHALVTGMGRKLNTKLVAAEAAQLIGGFSDPAMLTRVAPNMAQFMDGGSFYGAYGPRIKMQLPEAVEQLAYDHDTRQTQLLIWRVEDLFVMTRDKPCTALLQFFVRDDKLELHTTMRSNDIWWGVPYDVAAFCALQLTVAHWLQLEPGSYFHKPASLHLYERDTEAVSKLTMPLAAPVNLPFFRGKCLQPGIDVKGFVSHEQTHITNLVYGKAEPRSDEERWFVDKLTPNQ